MKKIFSLFAILTMAVMTYADVPVLETDYEWVLITESMTAEPTDMMPGVSQTDAEDQVDNNFADGVLYGDVPAAGGLYTVLDGLWDIQQMTWSEIVAAVADWENYYYPRCLGGGATAIENHAEAAFSTKLFVNGQLIIVRDNREYNVLGSEMR